MKYQIPLCLAFAILLVSTFFNGHEADPAARPNPSYSDPEISVIPKPPEEMVALPKDASGRSSPLEVPRTPADVTPSSLDDLPKSEQQSLWQAFSEARREARLIPDAWAQREENLGYDFYALHPKQNLTARFGSQGVQFVSSDRTYTEEDKSNPTTSWEARMHVLSFAGSNVPLGAPAEKSEGSGSRMEYRHRAEFTEWYDNGVDGMEHGYTIAQRPRHLQHEEEVVIEVALDGLEAEAHTAEDGSYRLNFNEGERTVLSYSKLLVFDANGKELPASMKPTDSGFTLAYNDTHATYPVTVDPLIINEEANLTANDAAPGDRFGYSVAISGDFAVIGAYQKDDGGTSSGSAYVFTRSGNSWFVQDKLDAHDAAAFDSFGYSVAISGDTVIVGAYQDDDGSPNSGSAYVFTQSGTSWPLQAKLTADDAATADNFGYSVAISGDSVVVGADQDDDGGSESGSAYVFTRSGTSWSQQTKLTANDAAAEDHFGISVAISGDSVVVGANQDDDGGSKSGSAYVFTRTGTSWSQQDKLTASDAATGDSFGISVAISGESALVGSVNGNAGTGSAYVFTRSGVSWSQQDQLIAGDAAAGDSFGHSVSISGDSVVVGAFEDGDNGSNSGSAYVFTRSGISWSQEDKLTASDGATGDNFGIAVAISGDSVVVGAHQDDDFGSSSGSAYVFTRSGVSWSQQAKLTANDAAADDRFGITVAMAGDSVVVGFFNDDDAGSDSGSAYVFTRSGNSWSHQAKLTANDAAADDIFGTSVAISGDSIVVGASQDDDGATNTGSAYVFTRSGASWSQQDKLTADDAMAEDRFGISVAISSESIVVGAFFDDDDGSNSGSTYVFTRSGTSWAQQAKLVADDAAADDWFGISVAISGDSIVVGAMLDDNGGTNSGSAYVFTRSGTLWSQQAKLTASDAVAFDQFGRSVAISSDSVVVAAHQDDDAGPSSGSAYVFTRSGISWSQQDKLTANDAAASDEFGYSVAISGDTVVVGARFDDDGGTASGSAYLFTRSGTSWSQQDKLTASDAAASDNFGNSVAISGDSVVVGAILDDDDGSNSGSIYVYRFAVSGERQLLVYDSINAQLLHSSSATPFAGQLLGTSLEYTFRLTNAGELDLDLQSISLGGADLSEFNLSFPDISSPTDLSPAQSLELIVSFNPSGAASGMRNALVNITSNDSNNTMFTFNISGLGLSNTLDGDSDGMNDWAEYSLRGFGFDWTAAQPNEVSDYYNLAFTAGLFTEAQLGAVNVSGSLVEVDPLLNTAAIVIGLEDSDDMTTFNPITAELSKITIDGDGKIRYEVDTSPDKKFIRAGVGE